MPGRGVAADGRCQLDHHVVGFALNEEQARLSCIAERGGGLNLRAASARELSNALFSVLEEIQVVVQNGFLEIEEIGGLFPRATITFVATGDQTPRDAITLTTDNRVELAVGFYDVSWTYATGGEISIRVNIEAGRTTWIRGSLLKFPQGAGEIYVVKDLAGTVIWQAPFEEGDYVGPPRYLHHGSCRARRRSGADHGPGANASRERRSSRSSPLPEWS